MVDRQHPLDPGPAAPDPAPSPSRAAAEREQAEALRRAVARLPDDYRRAVTLRYVDGLSFEAVGRELGRSEEAARKLWTRAMDQLRRDWEAAHDSGPP